MFGVTAEVEIRGGALTFNTAIKGNVVVAVKLVRSGNVQVPDVARTTPTVKPVAHEPVPPESVTVPAVVPAQTVCPKVTAAEALIGV